MLGMRSKREVRAVGVVADMAVAVAEIVVEIVVATAADVAVGRTKMSPSLSSKKRTIIARLVS
jgi:hypothetical protein